MEGFIRERLDIFYSDFVRLAREEESLCVCRDLTFIAGRAPDYGQPLVQDLYLLRYFPAYLAQYYLLYKQVLERKFLFTLRVASVGCGCGVDLWGLRFAVTGRHLDPDASIAYTGHDSVAWQHTDTLGLRRAEVRVEDAANLSLSRNTNVVMFPLSLSELSEDCVDALAATIGQTGFATARVVVLAVMRKEDTERQEERLGRFSRMMRAGGFVLREDLGFAYDGPKDVGISAIVPEFQYPETMRTALKALISLCNRAKTVKCACTAFDREPILRTRYFNFHALFYERARAGWRT
jgi:hypothetical protein